MLNNLLTKFFEYFYLIRQKISETARSLFSLAYFRIYFSLSLAVNIINWMAAYKIASLSSSDPVISLHYNVDFGVNFIGSPGELYAIPFLGLLMLMLNMAINLKFYKNDRFISHLLLSAAVLVNITFLISLYSIYTFNFR